MPTLINNLDAIRRTFNGGTGERPAGNVALQLCDEVEILRKANADLGEQLIITRTENWQLKQQLRDSIKP